MSPLRLQRKALAEELDELEELEEYLRRADRPALLELASDDSSVVRLGEELQAATSELAGAEVDLERLTRPLLFGRQAYREQLSTLEAAVKHAAQRAIDAEAALETVAVVHPLADRPGP